MVCRCRAIGPARTVARAQRCVVVRSEREAALRSLQESQASVAARLADVEGEVRAKVAADAAARATGVYRRTAGCHQCFFFQN